MQTVQVDSLMRMVGNSCLSPATDIYTGECSSSSSIYIYYYFSFIIIHYVW